MSASKSPTMPAWARLYLYALHGILLEVIYTALWEFVVTRKITLMGVTSVWALLVYGMTTIVIEKLSVILKPMLPLPLRGLVYLVWIYSWEFSSGYVLRMFGACPWDYEPWFDYHFMGLITLEYAPLWYIGGLCGEFLIEKVIRINWSVSSKTKSKSK